MLNPPYTLITIHQIFLPIVLTTLDYLTSEIIHIVINIFIWFPGLTHAKFNLKCFKYIFPSHCHNFGFPGGSVKNLPAMQETLVPSPDGKIPWRRKLQPIAVFLPGEVHGEWSQITFLFWNCLYPFIFFWTLSTVPVSVTVIRLIYWKCGSNINHQIMVLSLSSPKFQ